jgi:Xaa-Pro aminopeptidase
MNPRIGRTCLWLVLGACALAARAQDVPLFTSDFPPEEFAARRAKLYEAIGEGLAIVQGAPGPSGYTRFRQSNEFYYLCGIEAPNSYLLLDGRRHKAAVYLPHRNERRELGEGKLLAAEDKDELKRLSGIDDVFGTDLLGDHLSGQVMRGARVVYTPFSPAEGASMSRDLGLRSAAEASTDPWDARPPREGRFKALLQERFPDLEVKDLSLSLDALRLIKSPREIALIKKATRLADLALLEGMRSTLPDLWEHELDAVGKFVYFRNGAQGEAYFSLIASGPNAWFPHYNAGKRRMRDGELLLMDFAPDVGYYMSDITRMWPVNGHWSPEQREIYGFYLGCYRKILAAIRPGVTAGVIMTEAATGMDQLLASTKFAKPAYEAAARSFVKEYRDQIQVYPHLGHWVGMATHDVGRDTGPLRAGMVFTIEPALRVPEEHLYVRLEDLLVITDKGAELVSGDLPMDPDAIEKVMAEEGILQRYPRDAAAASPAP